MNIVDSSAWLEYFADTKNAASVSLTYNLPMADSIILATAQKYGATIWTQDADFKNIKRVKYFRKKSAS